MSWLAFRFLQIIGLAKSVRSASLQFKLQRGRCRRNIQAGGGLGVDHVQRGVGEAS
jgi:hypothetical protein